MQTFRWSCGALFQIRFKPGTNKRLLQYRIVYNKSSFEQWKTAGSTVKAIAFAYGANPTTWTARNGYTRTQIAAFSYTLDDDRDTVYQEICQKRLQAARAATKRALKSLGLY